MSLLINLRNNLIINQKITYLFLFTLGLLSRTVISYLYGDRVLEDEWAKLVFNLYNYNTLAMLNFDGLLVPNLWMPPIYAYFIYLHTFFVGIEDNLSSCVLVTQIIISSLTTIIFYKIILNFFSKTLSLIGSIVFCLFPLVVYSSSQISSATIYLFLLLLFFYLILKIFENNTNKLNILIGFLAGILILTRRDFILIYLFSLTYSYFFFNLKIKKIILILLVTVVTMSPYLTRNYIVFDKFIVHSGLGYNLWKAYSENANVEGFYEESESLNNQINQVDKDIFYRINEDKIYLKEAKKFIFENPNRATELLIKRFFSILFIDFNSSQKNYYNFFHILPNMLISTLSIFGLVTYCKKNVKLNYLISTMFIILLIYSLFALLPRYKLYILPFQIILSLSFLEFILKKLFKNN